MALDGSQVRVGVTGHVYAAPLATTLPTDVTAALPAAWVELGYTRTGPSLGVDTTSEDIVAWQSFFPVRRVVTGQTMTAEIDLMQDNAESMKLAFGGGTVTSGTGVSTYTAPATPTITERSLVFEIEDGSITNRWAISRASISLSGTINFTKDDATSYPLQFSILAPAAGGAPFVRITDDTTAFPADT